MERKKAAETLMRFSCVHCGLGVQLLISPIQNARPVGSASRFRKSRYCWRTKTSVSSIALGAGAAESLIFSVALAGAANAAPVPIGLDSFTVNSSGPSAYESCVIGIVKV